MAKKVQIINSIFLLCVLFFMACSEKHGEYSDEEMIGIAQTQTKRLDSLGVYCIQARANYYVCDFTDSSSYLITCDCMLIRDLRNHMEIISTRAKEDTQLPNKLRKLVLLIGDIYMYDINYILVKEDTVILNRFDGYYLTNMVPKNSKSTLTEIRYGWYANMSLD